MKYLMDTDVCVNIIRSKNNSVLRKICAQEIEQIALSSITVAELEFGAAKSKNPLQNYAALTQFLAPYKVIDFDTQAAHCYGQIRSSLEKEGKRIGAMDMCIAAQAAAKKLVLITNNYREFKRIEGLSTESWHTIELEQFSCEKASRKLAWDCE